MNPQLWFMAKYLEFSRSLVLGGNPIIGSAIRPSAGQIQGIALVIQFPGFYLVTQFHFFSEFKKTFPDTA